MTRRAHNPTAGSVSPPGGPTAPPPRAHGRARAFTLIELLTVVAIISLLLLIGTPSALVVQKRVAIGLSEVALGTIETALKSYHSDFDAYPPSNPKGGQTICRLLTGYPEDANNDQTPATGSGFNTDDGCARYGFRLAAKGRVFGPYNGTEKLDIGGGTPPLFVDAFRQPVMYYLFNGTAYNDGDNVEGPSSVNSVYARTPSGDYYRKDFLLMTTGPDGEWTAPRDSDSDDITNFK